MLQNRGIKMSCDEAAVLLKEENEPQASDSGNAPTLFDLAKQGLMEAIAHEKGEITAKTIQKMKDNT